MNIIPGFERRRRISKQIAALIEKRQEKRGLLIAFEGPDGSGKTTQRKLFKQWLHSEGHDVTTTKWNSSALIKPVVKVRKQVRALSAGSSVCCTQLISATAWIPRFCRPSGRGRP